MEADKKPAISAQVAATGNIFNCLCCDREDSSSIEDKIMMKTIEQMKKE